MRLPLATALLAALLTSSAAAARPNILLILSDDMGYSDLGCYGGEIATPHLDRLAAGGRRFTQFYNATRCCPTRASLLTGLYPHQAGMGFMVRPIDHPGYRGDLSHQAVTLAEVLRSAGYRTGMTGKWHVARSHAAKDGSENWPRQRGFDYFYGTLRGFGSFYDPDTLCRDNTFITPENDPAYRPAQFYYTDAISDNAVAFLRQTAGTPQPFFLYVAYTAAHWPLHALEKDLAKYRGKYDAGYDATRRARVERLRQLGLMPPSWQPTPTIGRWDEVKDKAWEARCMETYAAMIDCMDQGIGHIVAQLEADGRLADTLILFLQDNGACAERQGRAPPAAAKGKKKGPAVLKPMGRDELQTKATPPMQTRDGRPVRSGPGVMAGPADTYIGYGENWANVANTPFREYKHWTHEGGIATPLIAHWPAAMKRGREEDWERGRLVSEPAHLIDIMATCVDVSGATYPTEFNGQKIKPMEGRSLKPLLVAPSLPSSMSSLSRTSSMSSPRLLCWEHESNRAVRLGQWKLVAMEDQPWELYDMAADRTEMHNLAAQQPARVRELAQMWDAWAQRADVLPLGTWKPAYRTPGK